MKTFATSYIHSPTSVRITVLYCMFLLSFNVWTTIEPPNQSMKQSAVCITVLLAYECVFDKLFWLLTQRVYFAKDTGHWMDPPNKNPENTNEKEKKQEKNPIDSFEIFSQI